MDLQDITSIIQIKKLPGVVPLKNIFKGEVTDSKVQVLYNEIEKNETFTEEDMADSIYGTDTTDRRYTMLKFNLSNTLVHDLIFFDYSQRFSKLLSKSFTFYRVLLGIRILLAAGMRNIAGRLAKRLYDEATEYDVTDIRLNCLRILREDALIGGKIELSNEYNKDLQIVTSLFIQELRAEEECLKIESHYISSAARNPTIAEAAFVYENSLNEVCASATTSTIELYRYRILLYALQISNKYAQAIEICNEAKHYLSLHPHYKTKSLQGEFTFHALNCSIILRDYTQAILYGTQLLEFQLKGKRNWYSTLNQVLMAALHNSDYILALELYKTAITQKGMDDLIPFEQEKWKLCRGYIFLLLESGVVTTEDKKLSKEFKISDLINTLPTISKDKGGLNIQIHVLQILYFLFEHKYQLASGKIDLFNRYAQRYLNEEEYHRTHVFLTMLKLLNKVHYDMVKAEKQGKKLYQELISTPEESNQHIEFNEIIPYDVLWQWIIKYCKPEKYETV